MINKESYKTNKEINKDFYKFSIKRLIEKDERWKDIKEKFIELCTKPYNKQELNDEEMLLFNQSREYPYSFEEIDKYEKLHLNDINVVSDDWKWKNGKWTKLFNPFNTGYMSFHKKISEILGHDTVIRGIFYYPPGTCREWHSNKYHPHGWRIYLVRSIGDSYFNYIDKQTKDMIRAKDGDIEINIFKVGSGDDTFYHNVVSETADRWSIGFLASDKKIKELIELQYT